MLDAASAKFRHCDAAWNSHSYVIDDMAVTL